MKLNEEHGIVPQTVRSNREDILNKQSIPDIRGTKERA